MNGKIQSASGTSVIARLLAGRIVAPEPTEPPPQKRKLEGRILAPKPVETGAEPAARDIPEPVPLEQGDVVSGVVAAGVSLNSLRPLQVNPAIWDVFSSPFAILDGSFSGFRLPNPNATIRDFIGGSSGEPVEFDDVCMIGNGTWQRIPDAGLSNKYFLHARAILPLSSTGPTFDLSSLLDTPEVSLESIVWAGPFNGEEAIFQVDIASHDAVNSTYYHHKPGAAYNVKPEFSLAADNPALCAWRQGLQYASIDLSFLHLGDGVWRLYVVRDR